MKRKFLLLTAVLLLGIAALNAQNADNKWGIGAHFGLMEYEGDYAHGFYSFKPNIGFGASIARYLNPSFDLLGHFYYGNTQSANARRRTVMPPYLDFESKMYNLNLLVKYKFDNGYLLKESARLAPYVLAGIGGNMASASGTGENNLPFTDQKYTAPNVYGGLGLNFRISPLLSVVVQSSIMMPLVDKIDGWYPDIEANKNVDFFMENSVGVYITPGKAKKKDADGDGVTDKLDKCPDTPAGVPVDANGCPLDTDKDGILDYLDECPTVAGLQEFKGCPDTDKDGIQDKLDDCPDVFGLAAFKGCPDSDGDGVPDKDDRCPNTPKGYKVDSFGCSLDSDKDGIPDSEDDCPDKVGVSELKGCPFDIKAIISKYDLKMKPILFDFDSYKLKADGISALDKVATALSNHKEFGVQLDGHTDYIGSEEYNLKLSEKRANSAKGYLMNKGISDSRIRLQYFGESKPSIDNKSKEGRAMNRRVEYSLFELGK